MRRNTGLIKLGFISRAGSHAAGILGHWLVSFGRRFEHVERMDSANPAVRATCSGAAD